MTHVYSPDAGSVPPSIPCRVRRKATLFCPRCGHESPTDGDWVVTVRPETVEIQCPDCRTVLTTRPHGLATKERSAGSR